MSLQFQKTTLPNGVRIVTEHIPSVRSVSVGAWIGVGSRDETPDESGMCHFIEHMVFKGTRKRRMHHIAQRMENVGGYLNAFTSKEFTCYYSRCLDEHLPRALDTVLDLVVNPVFPEKELEREKDVVLEEMKMYEDTPDEYVFDLLDKAIYGKDAMGRPVIGTEESVTGFSRDSLVEFLSSNYTGERVVVAVSGNVAHARTVRLVQKALEGISTSGRKTDRREAPETSIQNIVETKPMQQAHLILGARGLDVHHSDRVALSVLNTVLGGGMSSRLNQNIREKYGYCYNIYSFANMHSDSGDFGVYMGTDATKADRSIKLIRRELDKLVQKPVSKTELERAKSQAKGAIMLGLENMSSRMMRIGRQELFYGRYFSLDEILDLLDQVTSEDLQRTATQIFAPERFSEIRLIPS
ncbi:MAG: pitrilysin family protein [Bacteroidetes bacterium]|nr:pitrilysin family protein [Bacteroidota bacterium]